MKEIIIPIIRKLSSFTYLNVTQFLGALNDNIYKLLVAFFLIGLEGPENSAWIFATAGFIFVLPFLLFSASSGVLADRISKRNIIIFTKFFELAIMLFGIWAFASESKIGSYTILFLLATQSAIFGPSKYGIIPEIVSSEKISSANGLMTSFTFLAIILGTFLATFLLDITSKSYIFAATFCALIALIGVITSLCIEYTPPAGSSKVFNAFFPAEIYSALKIASWQPSLLMACFGSAFFLFLGAYVQMNMIPFAINSLHLTEIQGGYLFLLVALGIGLGAVVSGKISGKQVELALVPLAGICVTITCLLVSFMTYNMSAIITLVFLMGFFGGVWAIPLDSYIQVASPNRSRGQIIAATNFISFLGVMMASGLLILVNDVLGLSSSTGFIIIGTIMLGVTTVIGYQYFDYVTRFIGMILGHLHFKLNRYDYEPIPDMPALFVCNHKDWNDTLIVLGTQRRRVRFFIQNVQDHSKIMTRLYMLLRIFLIPEIEPLENNKYCLNVIRKTLNKGISVCIFVNNPNIEEEIEKLKHSYSYKEILEETPYPIISLKIEKGERAVTPRFFSSLFTKLHIPARIYYGPVHPGHGSIPSEINYDSGEVLSYTNS